MAMLQRTNHISDTIRNLILAGITPLLGIRAVEVKRTYFEKGEDHSMNLINLHIGREATHLW